MNGEDLRPNDLQRPARDFPDLSFVIHHLAVPYFDEAVSIAGRFPNVYLSLAANLNFILIAPRVVQQQVGQLLQMVGSEKLCYASDAPFSGGPAPYLRAFMDMEIPEDLCDGYGYPQITRQDRENILGLTFARLMGVDVEAAKRKPAAA
jgi:predicted TIM-barrel fold metal-dependent hydrolase